MADVYLGNASMTDYYVYDGQEASRFNAIALEIFMVISIMALILPMRCFWHHKNWPALNICVIDVLLCLEAFVNILIWPDDHWEHWFLGYGLCDIEVLLIFPITSAFSLALCRMMMKLSYALDVGRVQMNPSSKMISRKKVIDLLFIWVLPIIQMCLHYLVQDGRYGITPVFGCADQLDSNFFTVIVIYMWTPIITALTLYYSVMLYVRCHKHRYDVTTALNSSGSGMSEDHFWKLTLLAATILFVYVPCQLSFAIRAFPTALVPYSWSNIHNPTWGSIMLFHTADAPVIQYNGWAYVGVAGLVFLFFGLNDEAMDTYRWILVKLGFSTIFPSLKEPRRRRSVDNPHWANIVAKLMRRFQRQREERERQNSTNSEISQSALLTATGIAVTSNRSAGVKYDSRPPCSTSVDLSASLPFHNSSAVPPPHGFLSLFRTTLSAPFTSKSSTQTCTCTHNGTITTMTTISMVSETDNERETDIGPRDIVDGLTTSGTKAMFHTKVWSSPVVEGSESGKSSRKAMTVDLEKAEGGLETMEDDDLDPLSPSMGSRAYRERERREMERDEREMRSRGTTEK